MNQGYFFSPDDLRHLVEQCLEISAQKFAAIFSQRAGDELLSRQELADKLKVGIATVDRMVRDDEIPSVMLKNCRKFVWQDVLSSLKAKDETEKGN